MADQDFVAAALSKVGKPFQDASAKARRQQFGETYYGILQGLPAVASALNNANMAATAAVGVVERHSPGCVECSLGCTSCCYQPVMATEAEVLLVADHVRGNSAPDAIARLRTEVSSYATRLRELGSARASRSNMRCPLLVDGACSVYAVRPFGCVMYGSTSRATCDAQFERGERGEKELDVIPVPALPIAVVGSMRDGFYAACVQRGMPMKHLDLVLGLEIALDQPDATRRWMRGEDLFASAAMSRLAVPEAVHA